MRGAVLVAIAAAVGNMLQGWDNSTISGALLYIKEEFNLQTQPTVEGLIVAMSLIGATIVTTFSGPASDVFGRRPMLISSSIFYFLSGLVMLWAPNVYVLLLARLLDGFGVGLAVTLVPVYISETAPSEIRGQLNTLPQFMGSGGMFVSYCMVFGMSLVDSPSWRLMLGVLSIPSLTYLALTILFLPESPRWLVSKGKTLEAKQVLQRLRDREDVAGELAMLVEGLGVGHETSIEEYIIGPANEEEQTNEKGQVRLYGPEEGTSWLAKPVAAGQSTLGMFSRHGSLANQSVPFMDPLVTLFGSVHENIPTASCAGGSMIFPNMGSMLSIVGNQGRTEQWDEESSKDGEDPAPSEAADTEDCLQSPLLSRQQSSLEKNMRRNSDFFNSEESNIMSVGGGWHLAYKYSEKTCKDGRKEGGVQRVYLHQEGTIGSRRGSLISVDIPEDGEFVQAAAVVSQSAVLNQLPERVEAIHPPQKVAAAAAEGPSCKDLCDPGIKRALVVGVGIQILQQASGINGVLYYTPQILEKAGVAVLLSNLGLKSDSASLLISLLTTLVMLPCIMVAMRLMDVAGRRSLMLSTIPILVVSLFALVLSNVVKMGSVLQAVISTISVMVYLSCFVTGFGATPNILCAEIFPTRVRGLCITLCAMTFWIGNITVTYSLPLMLSSVGLAGVFTIFGIACTIAWIFVFLKVPETKGMPLEVISEFFAVGSSNTLAEN